MNTIKTTVNLNKETSLLISLKPGKVLQNDIRKKIKKVYGVVFVDGKLVLIYNSKRDIWGFPGGTIEPGEGVENALSREMEEEANISISKKAFLGYGWIDDDNQNLQAFFYVDGLKLGDFISDPDESVTKNEHIEPSDYTKYLQWGDVGKYLIETSLDFNNQTKD